MLNSVQSYLDAEGRMMYFGGNGFCWVTTIIRRTPTSSRSDDGVAQAHGAARSHSQCHNTVSRVTGNVLTKFSTAEKLPTFDDRQNVK